MITNNTKTNASSGSDDTSINEEEIDENEGTGSQNDDEQEEYERSLSQDVFSRLKTLLQVVDSEKRHDGKESKKDNGSSNSKDNTKKLCSESSRRTKNINDSDASTSDSITSPTPSVQEKLQILEEHVMPWIKRTDAHITLQGPTQGHLPAMDWKASFRKACVIMQWVRPRVGTEPLGQEPVLDTTDVLQQGAPLHKARILVRLSTTAEDTKAQGVCVTVGDWNLEQDKNAVSTILTAYSLPYLTHHSSSFTNTDAAAANRVYASHVRIPLRLQINQWQLLTLQFAHPYLKRPYFSVSVDGALQGQGELDYPVLESNTSPVMDYNTCWQNVVVGGVRAVPSDAATDNSKSDDQKKASDLARSASNYLHQDGNSKTQTSALPLYLDVASIALYSQVVTPSLQALVAEAGPNISLQSGGRVVPTLPPVANWSKGSSLEGPKVGIPLTVHSAALTLQRFASSWVFGASATQVRVLGQAGPSQRLVCPVVLLGGTTENTPRVGLIRPSAPSGRFAMANDDEDDQRPHLYLAGHAQVHSAVGDYLLQARHPLTNDALRTSQHLSLIFQEQGLLESLVLPFFLALTPPGKVVENHTDAWHASVVQLHQLYCNDGLYAARLISTLAECIEYGGARVHEQVLQAGLIHVLASSLRLGLLRCEKVQFFSKPPSSVCEDATEQVNILIKRFGELRDEIIPQTRNDAACPSFVPLAIAKACAALITACCGRPIPSSGIVEDATPAVQMRRSSDLALTALFGLALDYDLWGGDAVATNLEPAAIILRTAAARYGGPSISSGVILRCQVSVQYFLDTARIRWEGKRVSTELVQIADDLSRLLLAMLLSSLSNRRSISQGEHDISACMGALSDSPLGGLGAHVVLNSLISVLAWCEVVPHDLALSFDIAKGSKYFQKDEIKMQVAGRLGRNLLSSQFHDVLCPMILSRTVFAGDRAPSGGADGKMPASREEESMSWPAHWRLSLLLFSWVSSIAGRDGLAASRSTGNLLLAAGVAGSLQGCMEGSSRTHMEALLMPPPAMALMIGSTVRDEWSYSDLLADRLQIMMPLIPGIVASLLPLTTQVRPGLLAALSELLNTVGGTFHRVYGGVIHSTGGERSNVSPRRDGNSEGIKAAKTFVPHFLVIAMLLEKQMDLLKSDDCDSVVKVIRPQTKSESIRRMDKVSWIDVSSESVVSEMTLNVETAVSATDSKRVYAVLRSCQSSVLNTTAGLIANAMSSGGSGASVTLWEHVLSTLRDSVSYAGKDTFTPPRDDNGATDSLENSGDTKPDFALAQNVLCHLVAAVIIKSLKRHYQWAVWSYELSSAMSGLCKLVEDMELLKTPLGMAQNDMSYSRDQVLLICALLDILEYGRDATGWCQLALPAMHSEVRTPHGPDLSAASKLLLPVLHPTFRVVLGCIGKVSSSLRICSPLQDGSEEGNHDDSLLEISMKELDATLTAAIVGLSFYNARDIALGGMAILRKASNIYKEAGDKTAEVLCNALLCKVAEELRERYKAEKRLRETTLLDAYEEEGTRSPSSRREAEQAQAVERILLGGDVSDVNSSVGASHEEITFVSEQGDGLNAESKILQNTQAAHPSEDFVLFHDLSSSHPTKQSRLGFIQYEGLASALDASKNALERCAQDEKVELMLAPLQKYLDAWDEISTKDSEEIELVKLFDGSLDVVYSKSEGSDSSSGRSPWVSIHGPESAADAMSTYFELAASEKGRLKELSARFLPNVRYSRISFAERYCWSRISELSIFDNLLSWERGMPDGNRDVRSRIPTIPVPPQFRRYIPKYLDHSPSDQPESPRGDTTNHERHYTSPEDLDAFTKNLIEAGNLEIVDITKKEAIDDDVEPDLGMSIDMLDDDAVFVESGLESEPSKFPRRNSAQQEQVSRAESSTDLGENRRIVDEDYDDDPLQMSIGGKTAYHQITSSAFATPPDNASSSLSLIHSAAQGMIEMHLDNCLHVKPEGSRPCTLLLTSTHLILEYDGEFDGFYDGELLAVQEEVERQKLIEDVGGSKEVEKEDSYHKTWVRRQREIAALRPKSIRWNLSELSHAYLRRFRLRDSSIELFFIASGGASFGDFGVNPSSSSVFLDFGAGKEGNAKRDEAAYAIMKRAPAQALKQWPDRSAQFLHDQLNRLALGWVEGRISNFDYLLHLNLLSGRSFNDICQYPVFPWVLSDYTSDEVPDLTDKRNFRDLSKPVGALNPDRLQEFLERFNSFADPTIPPFMYGSHYSTSAGVVLHFLVRLHPFAGLHRQLQSGHFDVADRLFSSVPRTWAMCTGQSAAEVKEITPEWYCNPSFLRNTNDFKLGTSQEGEVLGDVELPPWAKGSPEKFIDVMRAALESEVCSAMLSDWIDLIFGRKQQGPEAVKANNVFFYLTYYGSVDVASIQDESLRQATELQIAHFGQCPMQLFKRAHVRRLPRSDYRLGFYQSIGLYSQKLPSPSSDEDDEEDKATKIVHSAMQRVFGEPYFLPFFSAPLTHWVHLDAPPPGPHAALIALRLAGTDRCLAVDSRGVFHTFRWAWRPEETIDELNTGNHFDKGCFVAQRELPRFHRVPRLMHAPLNDEIPAVAISKTLFAGRSVLLVLSTGDSQGALGMQLVDPSRGQVRAEVTIPSAHSARITCISTEPIGTAAGQGGVGGELALVGSADGRASLWRFMSSHYLPLRPRVRLFGHGGDALYATALCSTLHVGITISKDRCCVHSLTNGSLLRAFSPPGDLIDMPNIVHGATQFAPTSALAVSVQGYIIAVCQSSFAPDGGSVRTVNTLVLLTIEGILLGSKPMESWRGLPRKIQCTPDGTAAMVCAGRGVTVHRLSSMQALEFIDELQVTETDDLNDIVSCFDLDVGPSLHRPVCAAAACSTGALRLHALPGISAWSERHKKSGLTHTVGSALASPARRVGQAVRKGFGLGTKIADIGRDIGNEVKADVKEKGGVGGFLGSMIFGSK